MSQTIFQFLRHFSVRIFPFILGILLLPALVPGATVWVMIGADTSSVENTSGGNVADYYENEFDMEPMSGGIYTTVMTDDYRESRLDSEGNSIVFTWYMLSGGWHHQATNVDAVAATRVYQETWGEESNLYGDEIALHFHHFSWNGSEWVMASTFAEKVWDFEWSISQLTLDNGVYPVAFRSGWNYMDNPYQQELERWIPFRLEGGGWMSRDIPYHPSFSNYRASGDMRGWEVRHRYLGGLSQAAVNQIFQWASDEGDQVTCWWSHQYESGFLTQIDNAHTYLTTADANFPDVDFRYVTARDGMRMWQGSDDTSPPQLGVSLENDHLRIFSEPDIYQINEPYIAARTYDAESPPLGKPLWACYLISPGIRGD